MPRKATLLLLTAVATAVVLAVPPWSGARAVDWPFTVLPKPIEKISDSPSPNLASPPPPPDAPDGESPSSDLSTSDEVPTGEFVATKDLAIKLNQTEGKSFKLKGEVWLDGPSPRLKYPLDEPEGFGLFLRQVDGLHRYEANSGRLRDKRRLLEGVLKTSIVEVATLPSFPLHTWIPFSVEATRYRITFSLGGNQHEIRGPLDTDGVNEIALVAGTKIKNIQVEILDSGQK